MTKEDIIRMAREAGIEAEADTLCRYEGFVEPLERFAALVIANNPPQSSMAWQEGYEAGKQTEREKVTKERDRMCKHCKWKNDENSTLDETNQSKVLGKS